MKINKAKLNVLLRSGLQPGITTRRQLAGQLELDPTSLTRWFSNRDRLGNPRYPVVPDRHVLKVLQIFELEPDCLALDDEAFSAHCFAIGLQRAQARGESPQSLSRLEKAAARKLTIPTIRRRNDKRIGLSSAAIVVVAVAIWGLISLSESEMPLSPGESIQTDCWTGYSDSLGSFDQLDEADPCHYGKLFHHALTQLKARNKSGQQLQSEPMRDYMLFLSKSLDQRRQQERATLDFELGRVELARLNYAVALTHFLAAAQSLAAMSDAEPQIFAELSAATAVAVYGDKPWRYARQSYERMLYDDPIWNRQPPGLRQPDPPGSYLRELALSELENGNLALAQSHIEGALKEVTQHLGEAHFSMASNWLALSRILTLQAAFADARNHAQKALELDRYLFGQQHPRVIQDHMVLTLLSLREGNFVAAHQAYQPISDYFRDVVSTDHPSAEMDHWLHLGLARLKDASMSENDEARSDLEQQAWDYLNKAFSYDNPFIPRRFAALVRQEAMSLASAAAGFGKNAAK